MRFRDRSHDEQPRGPGAGASTGAPELRERAERLLAAGDAAIERALSGDSTAYLRANQQMGGE